METVQVRCNLEQTLDGKTPLTLEQEPIVEYLFLPSWKSFSEIPELASITLKASLNYYITKLVFFQREKRLGSVCVLEETPWDALFPLRLFKLCSNQPNGDLGR